MNPRRDAAQSQGLMTFLLIGSSVLLGLVCLYYAVLFSSALPRADDSFEDVVDASFDAKRDFGQVLEVGELNPEVPKSIPVCDLRYSELIPCLDRNMMSQMKLKLNLSLMELYERHCYNCLIPSPPGYKISVRWPMSRDQVWKANIPHTHLAQEKSDPNWMGVDGEEIKFPVGGTHFHYGADIYIMAIAGMLKFPDCKLNNGGHIRTVLMWAAWLPVLEHISFAITSLPRRLLLMMSMKIKFSLH